MNSTNPGAGRENGKGHSQWDDVFGEPGRLGQGHVSLKLPSESECSFCAYLAGERPYTILARGPLTALLVAFEQRSIGHLLAIPTTHRTTLFDLTDAEASALMRTTITAGLAIENAFGPDGIAVWQNNGVPAHQSVPHVHFHIAGTIPGEGTFQGPVERLAKAATDAIADSLRPHLKPVA
jgi:histidine triad (HIT) family protein